MILLHDIIGYFILGASASAVGFFVVQRRQGMLADCVSHGALPGVTALILLFNTNNPILISLSATITALITMGACYVIRSRVRQDSSIGSMLGLVLGINIILLTFSQHLELEYSSTNVFMGAFVPGLTFDEFTWYLIMGTSVSCVMLVLGRSFAHYVFDPTYTHVSLAGANTLAFIIVLITVVVISAGIMVVGTIMIVSLLVVPTATLSYWVKSYAASIYLSGLLGGISCVLALYISSVSELPLGALITAIMCAIFLFSSVVFVIRGGTYKC